MEGDGINCTAVDEVRMQTITSLLHRYLCMCVVLNYKCLTIELKCAENYLIITYTPMYACVCGELQLFDNRVIDSSVAAYSAKYT